MRYDEFLDVKAIRFHQICQSVYVTTNWSSLIDDAGLLHFAFFDDFRRLGGRLFQTLASFCDQSSQIIRDELVQFNAQRFITTNVMSLDLFESQSKAQIQLFISSTKRSFKRLIQLVRELTQSNVLFPGLQSSLQYHLIYKTAENVSATTYYAAFDTNSSTCSCQQTPTCVVPSTIFYDISYAPIEVVRFIVPGIMYGCYIFEALLQSNLVCFYNQSCLNNLRQALNTTQPLNKTLVLNTTALSSLVPSQFKVDSTLGDIIDRLMVEEWITMFSHKNYYTACNPQMCTYFILGKNHLVFIMSTIIGILGSLTTILTLVVPRVVRMLQSCLKKCANRRVKPEELQTPIPMNHIL